MDASRWLEFLKREMTGTSNALRNEQYLHVRCHVLQCPAQQFYMAGNVTPPLLRFKPVTICPLHQYSSINFLLCSGDQWQVGSGFFWKRQLYLLEPGTTFSISFLLTPGNFLCCGTMSVTVKRLWERSERVVKRRSWQPRLQVFPIEKRGTREFLYYRAAQDL